MFKTVIVMLLSFFLNVLSEIKKTILKLYVNL